MDSFPLQELGAATDRTRGLSEEGGCYSSRFTSTPLEPCCKKHPGKPSCYFISEEPWVQLCQKCALNMALCGKKIERRLTDDERRKKLELEAIVFELKSKSKETQQKEAEIKGKIVIVQTEYLVEVQNLLRFYDQEIEEWTRKRNEVYKSYSEEILDYFKTLEQMRYRLSLSSMELKNSLQNIQNNFVTMIHDLPATEFSQQVSQFRKGLQKAIDSPDKSANFDKKREGFERLVRELTDKTESFKSSKHQLQLPMNGNSISTIPHSTKFRVMDNCDLRKHEQSLTPNKKINFPNLQDQLYFSREEELKLRLKPTASQVAPSNSKAKLVSDRKRINSKVVNQKKDEIEPSNTSRLHRA